MTATMTPESQCYSCRNNGAPGCAECPTTMKGTTTMTTEDRFGEMTIGERIREDRIRDALYRLEVAHATARKRETEISPAYALGYLGSAVLGAVAELQALIGDRPS